MSDRELLEKAAKAAGMRVLPADKPWGRDAEGWFYNPHGDGGMFGTTKGNYDRRRWNPLTDDGDALRLAVKLGIAVYVTDLAGYADTPEGETFRSDIDDGDPYAATRRAIVSAAAAIEGSEPSGDKP